MHRIIRLSLPVIVTVTKTSLSVLIIPIVFPTTCQTGSGSTYASPVYTQSALSTMLTGAATGGSLSLSSMFSSCSFNKTKLSSASTVSPPITIACTGKIYGNTWSSSTCTSSSYVAWADSADLSALSAYDIDPNSYDFISYIIPPDAPCSWSLGSKAYLGCDGSFSCRSWIMYNGSTLSTQQSLMRVLGNNLYLAEAYGGGVVGCVQGYSLPRGRG